MQRSFLAGKTAQYATLVVGWMDGRSVGRSVGIHLAKNAATSTIVNLDG